MSQPYNCRAIGTLVAVGIGFFIVGFIIAISTYEEECGTHDGFQCQRNAVGCHGRGECWCPERRSGHFKFAYTCKDAEIQWSKGVRFVMGIFSILFWGCMIASIVFCICRCIHKEDYERSRDLYMVPAETFAQGGKL